MEAHYIADESHILLSHVRSIRMYCDDENFEFEILKSLARI
jgi:hypothetical protein